MATYSVDYNDLKFQNVADFLLVTVTDIETEKLLERLSPISKYGILQTEIQGQKYYLGHMGRYNVIHCQCQDQGAIAVGGSIVTVMNALEHWPCVKAVIMVGIAFGMYDEPNEIRQQHIGDILIAKEIIPYERQKVQPTGIKYKEDRQKTDTNILDAFKIVEADWNERNLYDESTGMEICDMLSGEKLVNNPDYRRQLKEQFPTSRGGEMEGAGVASACVSKNIPWVLMKSVCDFGDGHKQEHKHARQACAAALAAEACNRVLSKERNLDYLCGGEKSNFYYQHVDDDLLRQIFFVRYKSDCEPYYLHRDIDPIIQKAIKLKGCWISGESGCGKSVALTRAIIQNGYPFVLINLTSIVGNPLDDIFCEIYETICLKKSIEPRKIVGYKECAKAIVSLIDTHYSDEAIYFFIEEIPLSESSGDMFRQFVEQFCALVINNELATKRTEVKFILSSISSPEKYIPDYQKKIETYMKFIHMPNWTPAELQRLCKIIFGVVDFQFTSGMTEEIFVGRYSNPRDMKNHLNDLYRLNINEISDRTLLQL